MGLTAVAYAALVLALPFLGDFGVPTLLVVALWIGGSYVAGMLAPWHLMALIAIAAAVVFVMIIHSEAASDVTFFSDPLSIVAIPTLVVGEVLALYFGSDMMRSRSRGLTQQTQALLQGKLLELEGRGGSALTALVDAPEIEKVSVPTSGTFEIAAVGFWDTTPGDSDMYVEVTVASGGTWFNRSRRSGLVVDPYTGETVRYSNFPKE